MFEGVTNAMKYYSKTQNMIKLIEVLLHYNYYYWFQDDIYFIVVEQVVAEWIERRTSDSR